MIAKKMPAFAFAALLAGCAGFTEDTNTADRESAGNSELGELIAKKYAAARTTETGKMSVSPVNESYQNTRTRTPRTLRSGMRGRM